MVKKERPRIVNKTVLTKMLSSLELCPDLVAQLMRLKPNKREHFQRGQRAAKLIQSTL